MPPATNSNQVIIGLDVGHVRIGVARGLPSVGIASPVTTLPYDEQAIAAILKLVQTEQAHGIVIGLPRNLQGDDTDQTRFVREYAAKVAARSNVPVYFQDEALTSQQAEAELERRGKPYQKADIDALAASLIIEDFMREPHEAYHG